VIGGTAGHMRVGDNNIRLNVQNPTQVRVCSADNNCTNIITRKMVQDTFPLQIGSETTSPPTTTTTTTTTTTPTTTTPPSTPSTPTTPTPTTPVDGGGGVEVVSIDYNNNSIIEITKNIDNTINLSILDNNIMGIILGNTQPNLQDTDIELFPLPTQIPAFMNATQYGTPAQVYTNYNLSNGGSLAYKLSTNEGIKPINKTITIDNNNLFIT
jgi:hypothetical protein